MSRRTVFVLSDATGETAEKVVRAALLQFADVPVSLRLYPRVRNEIEMREIVLRSREAGALIVFTLVNADAREQLWRICQEENVQPVDIIGSLMTRLSGYLEARPSGVPGLLHAVSDEYFRRVDAVDFTVKNDDGAEPRNLPRADLVLVGVSRTSKTPLSMYLAQKGYKVANVPLVVGLDPPPELFGLPQHRIFALTIQIEALVKIRQVRLKHLGLPPDTGYGMRQHIAAEIAHANELYRKHPEWPVLDVTNRAIEETASDILRLLGERSGATTA